MERRKAIAAAAAASFTLLAGAAGITLSSGIVGANGNDGVGQLSPVSATSTPPITLYVGDSSTTTITSAPDVHATDATAVTASSASAVSGAEDERHEGEHEDEHEDEHIYEGADDDD